MGEILQERNTRTSDFESNPLYSLTIESGVTPKTDRYERSSLVTKTEDLFKTVKPNEFVTNPMNLRFGALGYNKNAFTVSVSGYYDVFSIDDDKCSGFWNAYFKTPTAMNIFDNAATGSLIEKRRVKYSTLQQLAFYMPNDLSEKAEIGKYMDTFDHLITLHQRKPYSHIQRRCNMLNEAQSTDKFCEYYAKWITVYKKGAIRQVTMDKYLMTQKWLEKLIAYIGAGATLVRSFSDTFTV